MARLDADRYGWVDYCALGTRSRASLIHTMAIFRPVQGLETLSAAPGPTPRTRTSQLLLLVQCDEERFSWLPTNRPANVPLTGRIFRQ